MAANEDADPWRGEARELVASATALLRELAEEGIAGFERLAEPPMARETRPIPERHSPPVTPIAPIANIGVRSNPSEGPRASLDAVRLELGDCRRCGLCEGRQKIVFGDGNPSASILFVGEGPGEQEDRTGLPFVGRAGELLTQMIEKGMGLRRSDVYICNIVKCRPPGNRNPLPPEVSACRPR